MNAGFSLRGWLWVLFGMLPAFPRLLRIMVPFWREEALPKYQKIVTRLKEVEIDNLTSANLWQETKTLVNEAAYYTDVLMFATMGASAGSEGLLTRVYDKLVHQVGDPPATVLLMGWDNIPIRAEKSLYDVAMFCKEHELLQSFLMQTPAEQISTVMTGNQIPVGIPGVDWQEFCQCFNIYIQQFGYMIFELDFAKELPCDHFEPMLEVIKMYLRGEGKDPYVRQKSNEEIRIRVSKQVLGRLKGFRHWVFNKALKWAQSLSEVREDALAEIGLGYPVLRQMILILGKRFADTGVILDASDIFWLEKNEVEQCIVELENGTVPTSFVEGIIQRKAFWQKAKRSVPPPMVPYRKKVMGFNTAIWLPESEGSQIGVSLKGVPASPGRVTAPACILNGPEDFDRMRPGDVLVAGTTTPAWTPLFAMASAVVTDIGGPLSHGSIVAREYGIPSVMGTGVATRRIKDGQMVTVDGGAGTVTLL
jgi:phosphohistidine swiveling domain-containing protein